MSEKYDKTCENCGTNLEIQINDHGQYGNKMRETADCPKCGKEVASHNTSGLVRAVYKKDD